MELATVSRVVVETTPTFRQKVTQTLIERGALMRRVLPLVHEGSASTSYRESASNRVILEAVVDRAETYPLRRQISITWRSKRARPLGKKSGSVTSLRYSPRFNSKGCVALESARDCTTHIQKRARRFYHPTAVAPSLPRRRDTSESHRGLVVLASRIRRRGVRVRFP